MATGNRNGRSFVEDLLVRDVAEMPAWLRGLTRAGQFVFQTISEFGRDEGLSRAAGMAYTSLLALVPATAVFFVLFAQFADVNDILIDLQETLVKYVVPTSSDTILEFIRGATGKTRAMGLVGTVVLLVTTVLLFNSIESAFNSIFHSHRRRSMIVKIMVFTSVLVWGPLLIGMSVWATGQFKTLVNLDLVMNESATISRFFYFVTPLILTWLAFVGAFVVIPAARVRIRSAMVGGLVAGFLFELAKIGFPAYVKKAVGYSTLYGSLSVIPFFLIWLYALWLIALIGLEVAYTHQNFHTLLVRRRWAEPPRGRERIQLALRAFGAVAGAFERGDSPPTVMDLAEKLEVPSELADGLIADLEAAQLVLPVAADDEGYVPGRALAALPVYDLVRAVHEGERLPAADGRDQVAQAMDELVARIEAASEESVKNLMIADVLGRIHVEPPAS